jgi:hypothetical protein
MHDQSFTTSFTVDQTPEQAFAAINDVRGWWSEDIKGGTEKVGDIFNYRFRDIHRCTIKIKSATPGQKVVWHVLDNYFNFTADTTEWKGTDVIFEVARKDGRTEVRVTHDGLVPEYECYDICSDGWSTYVNGSLKALIETGKGNPNAGEPMNDSERALAV